jgi:hypothetical protein
MTRSYNTVQSLQECIYFMNANANLPARTVPGVTKGSQPLPKLGSRSLLLIDIGAAMLQMREIY